MLLSKSRLLMSGLAVAGLGAVALGYAAPHFGRAVLPDAERNALAEAAPVASSQSAANKQGDVKVDAPRTHVAGGDTVRVDAPHTAVAVNKESGRVAVRAPYADVKVDPDKGRVRVRAPYVDLDIRW